MKIRFLHLVILFFGLLALNSFGQTPGEWTWMHGDNAPNSLGVFGVQGVANSANKPPAVYEPCEWKDNQGNFWLLGGNTAAGPPNMHTALWKYDPGINQWTWMKGPVAVDQSGVYGTQGVPAAANYPGSRGWGAVTWTDLSGNLWLFGGYGNDAFGTMNNLNDLWMYNIGTNEWTWMKGPNTVNSPGSYGAQGVAASTNLPPSRNEAPCSWTDNAGALWLYGGWATFGTLGDLWKYDIPTNEWTWMHGANTINPLAVYGTLGVAAPANTPGGRGVYASWKDLANNLWLFSGSYGSNIKTSDLWKYDIALNQWTWMKGPNTSMHGGSYGTTCVPASSNVPTARFENRARVRDVCGNFWSFGGVTGVGWAGYLNDLWHYNVSTNQWTWVSGDNVPNQAAVYGTQGVSAPSNKPGSRAGGVAWIDNNGYIWIFGGFGSTSNAHNDLFRFVPDPACMPLSVVNVSSNSTICNGQSATLTATGGTSYSWSTGQSTSSITVNPTTSTTYTVTGSGTCGSGTVSVTVTVALTLNALARPNTTICSGQSATITASGGGTYSWNTTETTSSITVYPTANTTYSVIVSMAGCTDTASALVSVGPAATASISGNTVLCSGDATTLTATGGTNYSWSNSSTTNSITVNPTVTTTYSVVASNGSMCTASSTATVTVSSPPLATAIGSTTICMGGNATLTANGGGNYSWSTTETTSSITVSPTTPTTYTVIVSIGSCTDTATASIFVVPGVAANISGNTVLCIGDSTTLTATGGTNYSWSNSSTTNAITVNPTAITTYTVTTSNSSGCTAIDTITVNVSPPPLASVSGTTICSGQTATLTATGGGNYSWSTSETTSTITVTPLTNTSYSVIVSIGNCTAIASASVVVNLNPTANAASNVTITQGQSTTLSASGGNNYTWNSGDNGTPIIVSPNSTTIYCVTVTNANNCADTACVTVTVEPIDCSTAKTLYLPNAFSPNNDGENDVLQLYYETPLCIKTIKITIYNRWGEKVFETSDPAFTWNGTYNTKLLNTAVFIYYLDAILISEEEINRKGNVSLIK